MRVIKKKHKALAACIAICLTLVSVPGAGRRIQAAERVDTAKTGSLLLSLGTEDSDQMAQDMLRIQEPLQVRLWKLADMGETGKYEFREDFQGLAMEGDWKRLSEEAFALVYDLDENGKPLGEPKTPPERTGELRLTDDGSLAAAETLSGLELGLYLVAVDAAESPKYEYSFTPMVISLPWSEYQYVGGEASDTWQYEREAVLKPSRELRYGNVKILKTLTSYNESMGDVTFVFEVNARDSETGENIYSNVVSATFSATGTREILLEQLPAEAEVTVTEVYSGANCQITASDEGPKTVVAEEMEGTAESVTFRVTNTDDEEAKNGYGVENRFRYDAEAGTYVWSTDRDDVGVQP